MFLNRRLILISVILIASTMTSALANASQFRFALDTKNLNTTQIQAAQNLLNQATALLPDVLKNRINQPVPVHFIATATDVLGMAHKNKKEINLSTSLLPEIEKGPAHSTRTPRTHGDMYTEALATVLHESTHLYDDVVIFSPEDRESLFECNSRQSMSPGCNQLRHSTYLSSQASFLRVSGWYGHHFVFTFREDDAYEATNPRETLAVNMEYFLLDPNFACRKPSLAHFLSQHFQWQPFKTTCQIPMVYVNSTSGSAKELLSTLPIDRIYEVDFLLADVGTDIESRFGHAMLRLVICAPGKPLSEDCRKDISSNLVLSFRASVTDFQTSLIKGMTGAYPSRLFILPLTQVIQEYASSELRNLKSYPLKLTAPEKQRFLERAIEYHWNYQGKYYFLTNNCADETVNLLSSSTLRPELLSLAVAAPTSLYKDLKRLNLIDTTVLDNQDQAAQNGMFFGTYQKRYDLAFAKIQTYAGQKYDMKSWQNFSTDERYTIFTKALPQAEAHHDRPALAAAFLIVESATQKRLENSYLNSMAMQILKDQKNKTTPAADEKTAAQIAADAKQYLYISSQLVNPSAVLVGQSGYGLPSADELAATADEFAQLGSSFQSTQNNMITSIKSLFEPELLQELQKTQAHIKIYVQQITTKPITKGTQL